MRIHRIVASAILLAAPTFAQSLVDIPLGPNPALPKDPRNEDKAVFSTATLPGTLGRAFYFSAQNNRILLNFLSGGTWEYAESAVAIEIPEPTENATVAVGVVLNSLVPTYYNVLDDTEYSWMMYFIYQPETNGQSAGFPCAAFSTDGITWEVSPSPFLLHV